MKQSMVFETETTNTATFRWPCDRRGAHHAHVVDVQVGTQDWEQYPCPGVKAHPATMIGGNFVTSRPEGVWLIPEGMAPTRALVCETNADSLFDSL